MPLETTITALKAIMASDPTVTAETRQNVLEALKGRVKWPVKPVPLEGLLTRAEVGKLVHRTRQALWGWEKRGLLVPVKIGGKLIGYKQADIRKLLDAA